MKIEDFVILALASVAAYMLVMAGKSSAAKVATSQGGAGFGSWGLTSAAASNHYSGVSSGESDFSEWGLTSASASKRYAGI